MLTIYIFGVLNEGCEWGWLWKIELRIKVLKISRCGWIEKEGVGVLTKSTYIIDWPEENKNIRWKQKKPKYILLAEMNNLQSVQPWLAEMEQNLMKNEEKKWKSILNHMVDRKSEPHQRNPIILRFNPTAFVFMSVTVNYGCVLIWLVFGFSRFFVFESLVISFIRSHSLLTVLMRMCFMFHVFISNLSALKFTKFRLMVWPYVVFWQLTRWIATEIEWKNVFMNPIKVSEYWNIWLLFRSDWNLFLKIYGTSH